jgi:hypothetical protein
MTYGDNYVYWADWNGTRYSPVVKALGGPYYVTSNPLNEYNINFIKLSPDNSIIYITNNNSNTTSPIYYLIWNGTNYAAGLPLTTSGIGTKCVFGFTINSTGNILYLNTDIGLFQFNVGLNLIPAYANSSYVVTNNQSYANIYQKYLTVLFQNNTKYYDTTNNTTVTYTISGIVNGDIIDISNIYYVSYNDMYAGYNKPVYINNIALIGPYYYNYVTSISATISGIIIPAIILPIFNISKVYDRNLIAPIISYNLLLQRLQGLTLNPIVLALNSSSNPIYYSSLSGLFWTPSINANQIFTNVNNAAWSGAIWVAVGTGPYQIGYSYDGTNWFGTGINIFSSGISVVYSSYLSLFIAIGLGNNTIARSQDGINWIGLGNSIISVPNTIFGDRLFIIGGSSIVYSIDGINWYNTSGALPFYPVTNIVYFNKVYYAYSSQDISGKIGTSSDGINWNINNSRYNCCCYC